MASKKIAKVESIRRSRQNPSARVRIRTFRWIFIVMALVLLCACGVATRRIELDGDRVVWPDSDWAYSPPEAQGLDADRLAAMLAEVEANHHPLHAIVVVRNGNIVLEKYYPPATADRRFNIFSVTKSVNAALIGIAIDQGLIEDVEQPIRGYFPGIASQIADKNAEFVKIEDLLTMRSGLECRDSYLYGWRGLREMRSSDDWVGYMLDLPVVDPPGTRFEYCNGASYLLTAILQQATGMQALQFANEYLFSKLGIDGVAWALSPQGVHTGWSDMQLTPLDMARFGYLYLMDGRWENEQVVSKEWVRVSTSPHASAGTLASSYGYQWWVEDDYYMALGYGGQYIVVLPQEEMVVVFVSDLPEEDFFVPLRLLQEYILTSIEP